MKPLLNVDLLSHAFKTKQGLLQAVNQLSFSLYPGEILGLAGESGCGKSTLAKLLMRLISPSAGSVYFQGEDIFKMESEELLTFRRQVQMVFQNPANSLNPRFTVEDIIAEPFAIHRTSFGQDRHQQVKLLLNQVGLPSDYLTRLPSELSGGQKQRVSLARALALRPRLLILDEPVSALDLSIQAQILNLLKQLQQALGLTYLFISHDLSVLHYLTNRIAIIYLGSLVELAPTERLFQDPKHPYTQSLLASILPVEPRHEKRNTTVFLPQELPSPFNPPSGCSFHPRCPLAQPICKQKKPAWQEINESHFVACHLA